MKEMDPYNQSQSMGEAEEYGLLTQEDGERPNPWETKKSPEEEPERKDVPGWPKSWPKWLIWLFCAACFWFARNGMTLIKSYNEYQHWFDGVEEAGFHAETQHPDKEEPFVWIGRDGDDSYKKGEPDEDGYYWYKLSKRNSVYYPFERMMDSSVMVRSKKPIQSAGRGMYIRIEGHRVGYWTVRYSKEEQKNDLITVKYNNLPVYEADKVSSGSYMNLKYPPLRMNVVEIRQQAEDLTVTLERIYFREGVTLCYLRLKNGRKDGKTVSLQPTPVAVFQGQPLSVEENEWKTAMGLSGIEQLRAGTFGNSFMFLRTVGCGEEVVGALAIGEVHGVGKLELELPVVLQDKDGTSNTVTFTFTYSVGEEKGAP